MKCVLRPIAVLLCLTLGGCTGTIINRYGRSRALDLMDAVPISVAGGLGLVAEVRATTFLGLGIGYANTVRVGMDDQRFGPLWTEKERGFPIVTYYRIQSYIDREDRWSGGDADWRDETYRGRGNSWLLLPGFPRDGETLAPLPGPLDTPERDLWNFDPWLPLTPVYYNTARWEWPIYSWINFLNVEAGVVAGPVGIRVGVSPVQLVDFVLGLFRIDFARDDIRAYPILWPDPDAVDSFPDSIKKKAAAPPPPPVKPAAPTPAPPSPQKPPARP